MNAFDPDGMESQQGWESDESGPGNYGVKYKVYKHPDGHWISDQTMPNNDDFNKDAMLNMANAIGGGNPPERDWPPTAIKRSPTSFLDIEGYIWRQRATLEEELEIRNRKALLARIDWEQAETVLTAAGYILIFAPIPGTKTVGVLLLSAGNAIGTVSDVKKIISSALEGNIEGVVLNSSKLALNKITGGGIQKAKKLQRITNSDVNILNMFNDGADLLIDIMIEKNTSSE